MHSRIIRPRVSSPAKPNAMKITTPDTRGLCSPLSQPVRVFHLGAGDRARRGLLVLGLLIFLGAVCAPRAEALAPPNLAASAAMEVGRDVAVPQKARNVLAEIEKRDGKPPPGYVGGRAFQNRERRLPRGSYREYDVNPKVPGRSRGTERIVIEQQTGKAYYTRDHYETFLPMN